jgi:hypothetical protein
MTARKVGVLFADISGSTQLYRKIGTAEGGRALERCMKRIERAVDGFRGEVLMPAADEMLAAFPSPEDALQAAVEMQARIADLPPVSGVKLSIRIGVHFGQIEETPAGMVGTAIDMARTLLSIAGAHQIVTCAQTAEALSSSLRRCLRSLEGMSLPTPKGDCQLYEVTWSPESEVTSTVVKPGAIAAAQVAPPVKPAPPATVKNSGRFCLRFGGKAYLLDERTPVLTVGRDKANDVVIDDRKASRRHARVERRRDASIVLIDASTNGTFVAIEGSKELFLHNEDLVLQGRGKLALGHSTNSGAAAVAEFELM